MHFPGLAVLHCPVLPEAEVGGVGDHWPGPQWVQPGWVPQMQAWQLSVWSCQPVHAGT